MRRWRSLAMLVVIAAIAAWLVVHTREERLKRTRAAAYEQQLRSYIGALSPGTTRKRVEDELRARRVVYRRVYGLDATNAYADLVKIGDEPAPWYCNKNSVYIKFAFDDANPGENQISTSDSDILQSIAIKPWLEECL